MVHPSHLPSLNRYLVLLAVMLVGVLLAWTLPLALVMGPLEAFVPLHTVLEIFSVVVAVLVFASGWSAYSRALPGNAVVLACVFLGVAMLDFSHALSYVGMPDLVTPSSPQKAINFWLSARLLAAIGLLAVVLLPARPLSSARVRHACLLGIVLLVAVVHGIFLYRPHWVPDTYVPGQGLTRFKVATEFVIIGLNGLAAVVLWRAMQKAQNFNAAALFAAVCAMALSECFFTLYLKVTDVFNLLGHVYKVVAYLFLYRAVFAEVIDEPYRELASMRDQLKATLEAVPDVMLEVNLEGRYLAVHSKRPDLLLQSPEVLLGKTVHEVMSPKDAASVMAALQEALTHGVSTGTLLELSLPQGPRWFEVSISRKGEPHGVDTRFIVLSRDVTERKQTEVALRAREAADQASKAKSEFLSRMSHELRTPLNAVLGFSQLLMHGGNGALSDGQRRHVEHIQGAGEHLLEMINDILNLTRIESGHANLSIEPVSLQCLLTSALPLVQTQAQAKGVTVALACEPCQSLRVMADLRGLKQVLLNVLSNAIKYNRQGGSVTVRCERSPGAGDQVVIRVTDTGMGLSREQLQGLFEPFNRLGAERAGIEGTGLGLVISRRLIEAMGGLIHLDSTLGVGTEVSICLPVAADTDADDDACQAVGPGADGVPVVDRSAARRPTVLCIEDNPLNVALLRAIFDLRPSLSLVVAETGQQGLACVRAHGPDLILIDINLPDMSGVEVLHQLREMPQGRDALCIAMSADVSANPVQRARDEGFADFWPKPLDVASMLARLDEAIASLTAPA